MFEILLYLAKERYRMKDHGSKENVKELRIIGDIPATSMKLSC